MGSSRRASLELEGASRSSNGSGITVLYVEIAPEYGGATASLVSRLRQMDRGKVRSIVLCSAGHIADMFTDLGLPVYTVHFPRYLGWSRVRLAAVRFYNPAIIPGHLLVLSGVLKAALRLEHEEHLDIIHGSALFSNLYALAAGLILRKPVIWHINDSRFLENRWLLHSLARFVKKIVTICRYMEERFLDEGFPRSKIEMIHQPISVNDFRPLNRERCRKELGLDSNGRVLGFVGRLDPGKGLESFLEVGSLLKRDHHNITLLIAGNGKDVKYVQSIRDMAERLKLGENAVFLGFRQDVPTVMNSMDVLLFPSLLDEAFGRAVAEAGACGIPVVATDVGAVSEVIADQETGMLVKADDVSDMAEKVSRLLHDPDLASRMGTAARKRVKNMFSPELHWVRLTQLYGEVLAK